ncbi:MAG: UDP-N-acetylenolpyruvoylglucosamine reductase [Deltaproteobacteria bacterium]|nr:UDP-N-acetylenolpyruvoylglucosamine reductase [Deltaproteobacteria bacterium]
MIDQATRTELKKVLGDRIAFDAPMSKYTSLRVGGPADAIATPQDRTELKALLRACHRHGLDHNIIGSGFNLVVQDGGFPGVIIHLKKMRQHHQVSDEIVFSEAGVSHASLTRFCIDRGLSGLEFSAGIPGTVGGWLRMNAGIPGREQKDVVQAIETISADGEHEERIESSQLDFQYRELRNLPLGNVIVSGFFNVKKTNPETVQAQVDHLLTHRQASQPLNAPSCGSVFRNPQGDHAGRLIEAAGLKGEKVGGAQISTLHANFILNTGGATATDVLDLIKKVQMGVMQRSGIELKTEVCVIGRES